MSESEERNWWYIIPGESHDLEVAGLARLGMRRQSIETSPSDSESDVVFSALRDFINQNKSQKITESTKNHTVFDMGEEHEAQPF